MRNRKTVIFAALLCANLIYMAWLTTQVLAPEKDEGSGMIAFTEAMRGQYVLYIGTNDKDTYTQIIPPEEAREIVNAICAKYADGYTVSGAKGGWVDEAGAPTEEDTLVYTFTGMSEDKLIPLMDEVLAALNQKSILVERRYVSSAYYPGGDAA